MKRFIAFTLTLFLLFALFACDKTEEKDEKKNTVRFEKHTARVIAHRGLSGIELENTKEAFVAAGECSYYGIEADVRKTADGRFVICHDATLERISGKDINVETSTLDELLAVDLPGKDGEVRHLCELGTYISVCKSYRKVAILELKSAFTEQEIAAIIDIINSQNYIDGVTFISFSYTNLEHVRKLLPGHSVQYLFSQLSDEVTERLIRDRIDVAISYKALTAEALATFHNAGLLVNCWTIDDKKTAEELAALGVDYITTNILE